MLAVFAVGAAASPAAHAEEAPYFTIGGTRLIAGRTHNADAKLFRNVILSDASGSSKITCTGLGSIGGVINGSNAGTGGSTHEITVFTGCKLTGNGSACHLSKTEGGTTTTETITTEPIRSEQVENVEGGHVGKQLLTEFVPVSRAKGFLKLNFGGQCTLKSTIVAGSTVAEATLDNASEGQIELGQTPQQRTSWLIRFPENPIKHVWLISGGIGKEVETGFEAFNEESIEHGTALSLLASTKFAPEPNALWSPLP
jgi:hypothetical protein